VLSSLTSYLIQNRQVFIPHIGKFELYYKPATLDFANRLIYPPVNEVRFTEKGSLQQDQLSFLKEDLHIDIASLEEKLKTFGQALKTSIAHSSFDWQGLGELKYINDQLVFHPHDEFYFRPVQANRVIRENAHHSVLVGEREMHSGDTSYINSETKAISRSIPVIIGWIIAVLAVAFIGYYLYKNNFHPFSSGTKQLISIASLHSQVT
jgi:hypothetical protein